MDTPSLGESSALDTTQAASLLAGLLDSEPIKEAAEGKPDAPPVEPEKVEPEKAEPEEKDEATAEDEPKFTVKIDGKDVELTQAQIAEAYKSGLRQEDYTRKRMADAEAARATKAEMDKARVERAQYADGLQQNNALLTAALTEQQKIDWHALREADPVEFLKQQHLFNERQAALQETRGRLSQLSAIEQEEHAKALVSSLEVEHQALLDKLPEWKDNKKAQAERTAIAQDLIDRGFDPKQVHGEANKDGSFNPRAPGITDHKLILLARDAYLYRQTMAKASAEAKRVQNLPGKVITPGGGETTGMDKRSTEWNRFAKSGKVEDAAPIFARMF